MSTSNSDVRREEKAAEGGGRPTTLLRDLYARYVLVVAVLLLLVAGIQFQSLHSALVVAGENSLTFALRDVLSAPGAPYPDSSAEFSHMAPTLLQALSVRGINVRLYDPGLRAIGQRTSRYDPALLRPLTPAIAKSARESETNAGAGRLRVYVLESQGQILLVAALTRAARVIGYVELGYTEAFLYPILVQQAVQFLAISVAIILFSAAILVPVVRAPLRPLYRLIETATRIRAGAFRERLPSIGSTETVRLAEVINDALDKLAQAIEKEQATAARMKQFVSDASHELRTPLTAIRGFTDVLLRRVESYGQEFDLLQASAAEGETLSKAALHRVLLNSEKLASMQTALQTMQQETGRLEALVKDLLQLARLDGEGEPHFESVDLALMVEDMRPQLDMLARNRSVRYDLASAVTKCDQSMVQQIVYNLVNNAIQYTTPGQGEIWIAVRPDGEGRARLVVRDNGPGIDEAQVKRIFDRFYRASGSRERHPGGAGLGLAIVAEIVQKHGGKIEVDTKVGEGTAMEVVI